MGVGKVAVGALQPLGCLPEVTVLNNFQQCSETSNTAAKFHNMLLRQAGAKLNNESKDSGAFIVLYLFDAFTSVLNHTGNFNLVPFDIYGSFTTVLNRKGSFILFSSFFLPSFVIVFSKLLLLCRSYCEV